MPQINIDEVNGKVVVTVDDDLTPIVMNEFEVLQYRKFADNSIRFCNKERFADLPVEAVGLSDISINGVTPGSFAALDAALLTLFPEMPNTGGGGGGNPTLQDVLDNGAALDKQSGVESPSFPFFVQVGDADFEDAIAEFFQQIDFISLFVQNDGAANSTGLKVTPTELLIDNTPAASGSFVAQSGETVTVTKGIITAITAP